MNRLEREWSNWVGQVGLNDAPADQLQEMKNAFYAGYASNAFNLLEKHGKQLSPQVTADLLEDLGVVKTLILSLQEGSGSPNR